MFTLYFLSMLLANDMLFRIKMTLISTPTIHMKTANSTRL